jgi:hypothetical protein
MQSENSIQDFIDVVKQGIIKKFGDGKPKKVVIVGAGLADCRRIRTEARDMPRPSGQHRAGGRACTPDNHSEGLYASRRSAFPAHQLTTISKVWPDQWFHDG